jgi:hypothetical protein
MSNTGSSNDDKIPDSAKSLTDMFLARIMWKSAHQGPPQEKQTVPRRPDLRLVTSDGVSTTSPPSQPEQRATDVELFSSKPRWKRWALNTVVCLASLGLTLAFLSWWNTFTVNKRKENTALLASLVKVTDTRRAVSLPQAVAQPATIPPLQEALQQLPNVFVPPSAEPGTSSQTSGQIPAQAGGTPVTVPTSQNVYECPVQICEHIKSLRELNPRNTGLRELELVAIGNGAFFIVQNKNNISTICANNKEFADAMVKEKLLGKSYTIDIDQTCYQWLNSNSNDDLVIHTSSDGVVHLRFIK